ncbi:hypothetical protein [Deinococcus humi]|uniref:Uncharacterized protein n=1 Tax=Deinococcus humi TaxID=662880 RepID=A0A7W8JZH1_9DEIO|nr:hypothetical protein [Deinococcus humi]MBB5366072.1 hypothetical protein [Deinococcus humi]GGO40029.1 hypothetical protein GCM10008949_48990 [Deinococcus humi]
MTPQAEFFLPDALDARTECMSFAVARRYIREAGLIRLNTLEHIIQDGRGRLVVTQAIRQVVTATLRQLSPPCWDGLVS